MITTIIDNNEEHEIVTQQYQIGLYVIIDHDPAQQFGLDIEEKNIIENLEKHIIIIQIKVVYYDY